MFGIMMAYILVSFTVTRIKRCNGADNAVICKGLLRCPRRQVLTGIIVIPVSYTHLTLPTSGMV